MTVPLAEVPYDSADPDTREIYDAIAGALGVRLVNLVYRHLATVPGCLSWSWGIVGPLFGDGSLRAEAAELVRSARAFSGGMQALPAIDLEAAGLDEGDREAVRRTLAAYNRANPMNAISLAVVARALAEGRPARPHRAAGGAASLATLLPIAPLEDLPAGIMERLVRLARQATGRDTEIVPSLFRHFTAWPALLDELSHFLEAVAGALDVGVHSQRIMAIADDAADRLFAGLPPADADVRLAPPAGENREALRRTVEIFPPAICRMIVLGVLIAGALTPSSPELRERPQPGT